MKVSYNWLNKYFDGKLPPPEAAAEAFTFHAWEIEDVEKIEGDTVLDVKVLPDKSMWGLSHRGIAKDLSVILNLPLNNDPLTKAPALETGPTINITLDSDNCRRFAAAHISGVKVGPSPEWLKTALQAIGQRSINNIVDASNYVMFDLGQPSHAFDAKQVGAEGFKVRHARVGEKLTGLDGIEYTFTNDDTIIARNDNNEILSVAGLKGGQHSGISDDTSEVIVEVANWNPITTRKTGQRLKLRTDASARYENGIVPEMVPYGLRAVVDLIIEIAGGEVKGFSEVTKGTTATKTVSVTLSKINSVLGVSLTTDAVSSIFDRFNWQYKTTGEEFEITPPFERTDLTIPEDVIEEVGRIYGYQHVTAVTPETTPLTVINKRFYYSELVRDALISQGFSEIFTSSFRAKDEIKIANALASDKGYLRSSLRENVKDALQKNAPNADLLGLRQICLFEIGTVFNSSGEHLMLSLGVQSPSGYKAKLDDPTLAAALKSLGDALQQTIEAESENGVLEINLGALIDQLPSVSNYQDREKPHDVTYHPFSTYPAIARDIAMWADANDKEDEITSILKETSGPLCARITLFDRFEKDGRTSYAFRIVFQSNDRTLTDVEINSIMDGVYKAIQEKGFEVR
ncbi:hypothetical protein A2392_01375 [Candidatus Kaiserbacteria bacterium RIFOXYB1_FULL_46_14]|uniref:phenylalanine--tRNA ligase n=1 Tax=Candidatus Kaiserbacteria bacterium RIFOXYB1_FULL_46_14 TaxID=1798531 RepID=A0A1F6FJR2_9BACT|nr:MAG: hypothetical protein A2392_01375 [Candidatus Kaiserbacteria bacterium RIFOXYB1_FULL_46_14]